MFAAGIAAYELALAMGAQGTGVTFLISLAAVLVPVWLAAIHVPIFGLDEYAVLEMKDHQLTLGKRNLASRGALSHGHVVDNPIRGPLVVIQRTGLLALPLVLQVHSVAEGTALLRRLGMSAEEGVTSFRTRNPYMAWFWALLIVLITAGLTMSSRLNLEPFWVLVVALAIFVGTSVKEEVTVGRDGLVRRWMWRERFIALDSIAELKAHRGSIHVVTKGGQSQRIGFAPFSTTEQAAEMEALLARVKQAQAHLANADVGVGEESLLTRGGGGMAAWVNRLRGGALASATHRRAPLSEERLWTVVEGASAAPLERAAAAVVLAHGERENLQRLRVVADATALPAMRIAIEAAIDDDEAAIRESLVVLEQTPRSQRS